jgi:type I restriction enzyme S subunit
VKTQELNDDFLFETVEQITEDALAKSSAKLFPTNTLLVSMYGGSNIGRTAILAQPATSNQACCALFPKDSRGHFIYLALYFRERRGRLIALAQGAAQTNINQQVIRALPIVIPPVALMTLFVEALEPAFEQMKVLKRSIEKLTSARDLLMPRLVSGQVSA